MAAGAELAAGITNNVLGIITGEMARRSNFMWNEAAADNADKRTRKLYKDFYSPQALLDQYAQAGLSPSMMFGGTPGQGGMSGAQGAGVNQPAIYNPISALNMAQIDLIKAQADNVKADTELKKEQTTGQELQNFYNDFFTQRYKAESMILGMYLDDNGEQSSIYEAAEKSTNYKEFMSKIRKHTAGMDENDVNYEYFNTVINTEAGQQVLRNVWKNAKTMDDEIAIVTGNAKLTKNQAENEEMKTQINEANAKIAQALVNSGFAEKNAQAQIQQLEQLIEESKFNATIKGAWNRIISSMKDGTTKDILIILALIFGQAMSKAMPTFNFSGKM